MTRRTLFKEKNTYDEIKYDYSLPPYDVTSHFISNIPALEF